MDSTGFFFAALYTGKNVATIAVTIATPTKINADIGPNTKRDTPESAEPISVLIAEQATKQPIRETIKQVFLIWNRKQRTVTKMHILQQNGLHRIVCRMMAFRL